MNTHDPEFANEMTGRILIDPAGSTYAVIEFDCCSEHTTLRAKLVGLEDGQPVGPVREIDSIAGWMVGAHTCICWAGAFA